MTAQDPSDSERPADDGERRRFDLLFEETLTPSGLVDSRGVVRRANPALCAALGFSAEQLEGMNVISLVPAESQEQARHLFESVRTGARRAVDFRRLFHTPVGPRWIKGRLSSFDDHDGDHVLLVQALDITTEVATEEQRRSLEEQFEGAFAHAPEGIAIVSEKAGGIAAVNPAFREIVGLSDEQLLGMRLRDLFPPEDHERLIQAISDAVQQHSTAELTTVVTRPDGGQRTVRCRSVPRITDDGVELIVHIEDVTVAAAATEALRATEARFAALIERSSDVICLLDGTGCILYASPAGERLLGHQSGSLTGTEFSAMVHPDDVDEAAMVFAELLQSPEQVRSIEIRLRTVDDAWRNVEVVAVNRLEDPDVRGIVANVRDVTERAHAAARLRWQAFHDSLTGLPNRALLVDRLGHALEGAHRDGTRTALLYIDLDRFKAINDSHGHDLGDQLLIEVGRRLAESVRAGDTVARFGGDEFVVLAEALDDEFVATAMAARINRAVAEPMEIWGTTVDVSASIGVAFDVDRQPESLLRDADNALYRAKQQGKNRFEVYDEALRIEAMRRISTEQMLRRALDDPDGITVHYQPVIDLHSGELVSLEALMRIRGSDGSLESPGELIAVAEESGLIVAMGAGVLDRVCAQLATWRHELGPAGPRQIAVNVSARQLASTTFVDVVRASLHRHGLLAADLIFELTESTIIGADRSTTNSVDTLHAMGISLVVDDFGTGYSSLAYLKRFPVDAVKLDQTFVAGLGVNRDDTEIVKAVISLGRSLGLVTVAEGIETAEQLATLRRMGCDQGQGFHIGRPAPPSQLGAMIAALRTATGAGAPDTTAAAERVEL